ncbi:Alginate export [Pseudomonas sp. NFACC23-1]|uniref:alginate export family protein n=1 Tax=unclassified Pseudomonas TaxID=196821 RepID=UPI000882EBD6|nr:MULTISPECIES: alginate export family protein [unclassified Pseudomonas]SDB10729.1 Alginate export [Pseudomonas sp. NFACC17-2]SEI91117.1 Alginate export [Pseudomonas sp. NFACC23-1]SFW18104.1 Alginate export [Pseudomonas sp. NFACC16-2]
MHRFARTYGLTCLSYGVGLTLSGTAFAGYQIQEGDFKADFTLSALAASVSSKNANFGAGAFDIRSGKPTGQNHSWQEFSVKPGVTMEYSVNPDITLLAGGSIVAATTQGGADPGGYTRNGANNTALEELYGGVQVGDWKLTVGNQNFAVGNMFLIGDGNVDAFGDGAYYSAPRTAYRDSVVLNWTGSHVSAQAFSLRTDGHAGDFRLQGLNADWQLPNVVLGAMAYKVDTMESELSALSSQRNGQNVYNLRALKGSIPSLPGLVYNAEYALEKGSGDGIKYDAKAWYGSLDYTFSMPSAPSIGYRYAYFSGDDDPGDNTKRSFDPSTKGYTDWGQWLIGEVVGNYVLYNSNAKVSTLRGRMKLNEVFSVGAQHHHFELAESNYFGTPVTNKNFANETGLYLEWTPTPSIYSFVSFNWVQPLSGAKQALGDETFSALEFWVAYKY